MSPQLNFLPEVKNALEQGRAVVALESTVITHGLPSPENVEVARAVEATVREQGAVPATIAVLRGKITVGLTPEQLIYLGSAKNVRKCSRRDFPIVVARGEDGATTVAGTMMVAHWAGIRIFATGGIGGVHRGQPFDESADLLELGRTPVAVVCAGAKAILDLPLTLEVLETQGVPVIGYQTDEFPAFYSRSSGLPLELRLDTPEEIAAVIKTHDQLSLNAGTLIVQPIPVEAEWPAAEAQGVIEEALRDAAARHITGKTVTPYLLQRVSDLSGERSKTANIALLLNNARLAAQIALAL
ncbi:MAG: pseudouridine-5'-phosphate glycosidase [Anaerolineales bacterium]|nr:pseudouridine-5'-phosphate glycosidase [Anaerolineales bacterium]